MKKNLYAVIHEHRFGTDVEHFRSKLDRLELPDPEEIAKLLGLNFEPDLDESLEIVSTTDADFVDLDLLMARAHAA